MLPSTSLQGDSSAGKAVVYQWKSRTRTPSPVFWERILGLEHRGRLKPPTSGLTDK